MLEKKPTNTNRLIVRAFSPTDADDLYAYLSDERVYQFEPGTPISREEARRTATELTTSPDYWAVELQTERRLIGHLYFKQTEPPHLLTWELGYILSPHYQRRGYASEAVAGLLAYAFAAAPVHRVVAHCSPDNIGSWKLLEKVGFQREGLLRQNIYFRRDPAGEPLWMNSYVYGLLATDRTT